MNAPLPATAPRNSISPLLLMYLLGLMLWLGLRGWLGDGPWWLMLLNSGGVYLFLPAIFFLVVALLRRRKLEMLLATLPILFYLTWFAPYLIPRPTPAPAQSTLRILTFNVLYSNQNYEEIAALIHRLDPDLIALQEVQPEMMRNLVARLEDDYPHFAMSDVHPYGTTAAFSRIPLTGVRILDLEADRRAVVMKLTADGKTITFLSAHLRAFGWPHIQYLLQHEGLRSALDAAHMHYLEQQRQADLLVQEVERSTSDLVILGCDCNTKELMQTYATLADALQHASRRYGWRPWATRPPGAYPDRNPQHLDYLFFRGDYTVQTVYLTEDNAGSDHHPLLVELGD